MSLEGQASQLRAEMATLKGEVELLRSERDVARMLNRYAHVHDQAFSPGLPKSEELDRQFEEFFTDDGICDAFGVHMTREGKAEWVRSVLSSQGNIVGMQMVTSNVLIDILGDGATANARTSAFTTISGEGQAIRDHHRAVGHYMYRLKNVQGEWKIAHLKWHGVGI
ncbi:hypothetical protein ACGC1H_003415 [Rhizoctonia solani]